MTRIDALHHESDPLLSDRRQWEGIEDVEERQRAPAPPTLPDEEDTRTITQRLAILVPYMAISFLSLLAVEMINAPLMEISEAIICRRVFDDVLDPTRDPRCKESPVQSELALINGWELTFALIPSILFSVPFGMLADKYGRQPIMLLALIGVVLSILGVNIICLYPDTFSLRLRWLMPIFRFIGGGLSTARAISYTVLADATLQTQRSIAFLHVSTLLTACALISGPLTYLLMNWRGSMFALWAGTAVLSLTIPIAVFLPESRSAAVLDRAQAARQHAETSRKLDETESHWRVKSAMRATRDSVCSINRTLFVGNPIVGMLIVSTIFITVGKSVFILLLQYVTTRFGCSFAEAGLLLSIKSMTSMVLTAFVLPAVSQLLLKLGKPPIVKDTWILRISAVICVVGLVAMGAAPTMELFIGAMIFHECGYGLQALLRSVATELIDETHMALLMTVLNMSFTVAVSSGSISRSTSDGLIGAGAIICFILATSRTLFEHWEYRAVTFIRGILIVAIYDKMQRLRAEDLQGAAAVTLMSVDVDGTETLVSLAYEALSCTIQLSLGIWVLYRFVSVAAFLIFVPTILTFIGSLFTGSMIATARAATNAEAQKRVAATSNILAQIKSIKSMGLSGSLSAYIEHKRENEIKSLARAAFAEEDVIIVDDIFSSVDPDTAATIFERLFGPKGLVRQWNCTVVMSTNRLELLDFADQIYLFSKDGRVTLQNGNEADVSTDSTNSGEDESNEEALGSNRSRISGSDKDTEPPQVQAKKSIEEPESNSGTIDLSLTSDEKEHTAIEDLTVTLRGKQKIGLMGRTGSGKSTVISALLRMVDYTGSISIDGLDTRRVPRELLRSKITTIPQDGLRLNESLRFNLYPFAGERPSDDEMIGALQTVGVWNHARANGGLDADYFKLEFSKGQKQLIFLARAILHQRKTGNRIVLMDEVTSSMAEDAEPELQRLIDVAFSGCTIIMVSHRMESFQTADVILRFSSGKIDRVLRRRSNGSLVEG
ncbi:hypothetical protein V2A60_002481 [Cordyceps javanica]